MKYKKSKYNVITTVDNKTIVANILHGTMVEMGPRELKLLENVDMCSIEESSNEKDLFELMAKLGFIFHEKMDEDKLLKYLYWKVKEDESLLNVTINPSFLCNLHCVYCYQQERKQEEVISEDILEQIYRFILSKITYKVQKVTLNWCGGEALVVIDKFYQMAVRVKVFCEEHNIEFETTVSTNGVLLGGENIKKLKCMGTKIVQTTLAGDEEDHDMLRPLKNGGGSFKKIIDNIKTAQNEIDKILVIINLTKTNINGIKELLNYLKDEKLGENVYIVFKRVLEYGIKENKKIVLDRDEYNKYVFEFSKHAISCGLSLGNMANFKPSYINCYSGHRNTFSIDFHGNVHRCIERDGNRTYIGTLNKDGVLEDEKIALHTYFDVFDDERCIQCAALPSCGGGCISRRILGEDYCEDFAKDLENTIKLSYLYKKRRL